MAAYPLWPLPYHPRNMTNLDLDTRLSSSKAHSPFTMPEGYAAQLTTLIMQRIKAAEALQGASGAASGSVMRIVKWLPYIAAACLAALTLCFTQLHGAHDNLTPATTARSTGTSTMSSDAAYDYLSSDHDTYNLALYTSEGSEAAY